MFHYSNLFWKWIGYFGHLAERCLIDFYATPSFALFCWVHLPHEPGGWWMGEYITRVRCDVAIRHQHQKWCGNTSPVPDVMWQYITHTRCDVAIHHPHQMWCGNTSPAPDVMWQYITCTRCDVAIHHPHQMWFDNNITFWALIKEN